MKSQLMISKIGFLLSSLLLFFSCKQRDDFPNFPPKEVVEIPKDTIPLDNNIGNLTQLIMSNTDLIKTFKLDSTVTLKDGITRTHLRYINKLDQLMSMQILEVDLSKPNLTAVSLSPFDDYLSTTQTISDMAKYNESRSGGEIIAGINGDANTSGIPTGSFIKNGRQIKTSTTIITGTANVRPFFAIKYDGTPIIGNRPNTTEVLNTYNLNDFKHLISGGTWLVYKNNTVNSTVLTVQANTAIGLGANRKVIAVVVDGGTSSFSAGITFNDLGKIMKVLGCTEAFSTNVGTSSVMVERALNVDNRLLPYTWRVVNSPTILGGAPSANGIGFVLKK